MKNSLSFEKVNQSKMSSLMIFMNVVLMISMIFCSSAYEVGIDYHAYGTNFTETVFLTRYHNSTIRDIVLVQLQGIADRGASFVTLDIWIGLEPGTITNPYWMVTFPISEQEMMNLHQYTEDVASIQSKVDGH